MSTPSAQLAALLRAALPADVEVISPARDGLTPKRLAVMVRIDEVQRDQYSPLAQRRYVFGLILVCPSTDQTGKADDSLDALLEDVLYAIEKNTAMPQWTRCVRATYEDRLPAYEVTLPTPVKITDTTTQE